MTAPSLRQQLFRRKPVSAMVSETGADGDGRDGALLFLGSTATKILRASPVPVVVVPRGTGGTPNDP